ncbi:hypothetical protein MJO29_016465 [Puccinia striiformis f. sp. tritici]|nr:hypothetical protein MJO29_016465 [Puccinia striiformis f. sp. tritici]
MRKEKVKEETNLVGREGEPLSKGRARRGSYTGPNHLSISTPDLMTCDSPPFFPASATLEPRPSLADRLSSKGKKKNPPFQLHSLDQLPLSSRPVSPRTKNILDGIGIENHNSRIDIENDLEITTGFGPCPAAETAPPPLRTSGLTFKPPHDQRTRSHTPPHQQRSQSSSCTQLDSRRRLALFTSSPSNLLIGPSSQKQTIHSSSQSHSSSECPSHSHSVFLKEHGDAKTLVGDHSDSGTKTKKLAVDPQSPRPIIVTNPRPDLNKLIKPLSSLHPTNQITLTKPPATPEELDYLTSISAVNVVEEELAVALTDGATIGLYTGINPASLAALWDIPEDDSDEEDVASPPGSHLTLPLPSLTLSPNPDPTYPTPSQTLASLIGTPDSYNPAAMGSVSVLDPTEATVNQQTATEYERLLREAELADYLQYLGECDSTVQLDRPPQILQ